MASAHGSTPHVLGRGSWVETSRVAQILRKETLGGALLLVFVSHRLGARASPPAPDLGRVGGRRSPRDLLLRGWARAEAGVRRRRPTRSSSRRGTGRCRCRWCDHSGGGGTCWSLWATAQAQGWAVPTATDIAFALAVLAVIGTHLPAAPRTFLLTLAVVDDLLAIIIIAFFYTTDLAIGPLLLAVLPLAAFGVLVQRRIRSWWLLAPLALHTWGMVHASGVHATRSPTPSRRTASSGSHPRPRWLVCRFRWCSPRVARGAPGSLVGSHTMLSRPRRP
jgi:NhaA family Na+:H+ antiporter